MRITRWRRYKKSQLSSASELEEACGVGFGGNFGCTLFRGCFTLVDIAGFRVVILEFTAGTGEAAGAVVCLLKSNEGLVGVVVPEDADRL